MTNDLEVEKDDHDESFESVITTEVEFLEAVYINELVLERNEHGIPVRVSLQLHPATGEDTDQQYVCLNLAFVLPADYPHTLPEIHIKNPRGLSESHVQSIRDTLHGMAKEREGSSMLYDLIEYTKESLNEVNIPHGQCVICLEQFCESDIFKKTECYHYFHSYCLLRYVRHCLKVIEEEQMQALRHKSIAEKQVVCPVCREPLTYDLEALEKHPEPTGEKDSFKPDLDLRERQRKMAEMFEKQKLKGGIIDVEAERNKFYITLGQRVEFAETETAQGVSDIVSTSENPVLKVEGEQQASSKQGHGSRYRGGRFEYGKGRDREKQRRRGMGRGFRRQSEHHNGKDHGKNRPHPENNYVHTDQSRKHSGERYRQHGLLNGQDEFLNRKPGDRRQLQTMDEYQFNRKKQEDEVCLVDDKVGKLESIDKKSYREDVEGTYSNRDAIKKENVVEDIRLDKLKKVPGPTQLGVKISHFGCDVEAKGLLKTEKSDQILDDKSDKQSDDLDSHTESYKISDKGFSGCHKPVQAGHNRPRKSYRKPPRTDRNVPGNRQHTPGSNRNVYSSEDRHTQSNSEARFRDPERKCLLNGEREDAVSSVPHMRKDEKESDCRIVMAACTSEKKNLRMESFNRNRNYGTGNYQVENWKTAEEEGIVDDNKSQEERRGVEDKSKIEDRSRGRGKNNSGRYSEKSKMQQHAVKTDPRSFRKNEMYYQERKRYTCSGQKSREVLQTSSHPQKSSESHCPLSQDESLEDWSVESYRDRNEKKRIVRHQHREKQRTDKLEFQLDRTNKGNGNIGDRKETFREDNYVKNGSVISSSDRRSVERKSNHLNDAVKQKKLPGENLKKYPENNCDYKIELENCVDVSVDSFKKGKLESSEMPSQGEENVRVGDSNDVANKVSERNCGRIPPGFHTVRPPPGFATLGNVEASVLDVFR